jgi:DMSO/TMAO reductase YedYZ molybdopterin-dependent catalytic subunit
VEDSYLAAFEAGAGEQRATSESRRASTLRLVNEDEPGFWESLGYHNHGDPWREQRYWGD